MQVCGSKSFLQWTDFCNPWEEDSCEFLVVGPGGLSDLDTRINQERQVKKVCLCEHVVPQPQSCLSALP